MPKYQATEYLWLSYIVCWENESGSIINQKKLIVDFLKNNLDIELVSERVDEGYSGILFDHPANDEGHHKQENQLCRHRNWAICARYFELTVSDLSQSRTKLIQQTGI